MTTGAWTEQELAAIDRNDEVDIAPRRTDGSLAKPRIVWAVRVEDAVYIRSVNGIEGAWYRTTRARREGHLTTGPIDWDIAFTDVEDTGGLQDRIDAAYRSKYARYRGPVASITADKARATTLRLTPQQ
jgi:hypothetical protein